VWLDDGPDKSQLGLDAGFDVSTDNWVELSPGMLFISISFIYNYL